MAGPLQGIKIIELAGLGPAPFAGMMLGDNGAEIVRIERFGAMGLPNDPLARNRKSIAIDMKSKDGIDIVRRLIKSADGLIEGFRPGVLERMGIGPDVLLKDNPNLVIGRMTGWGQTGPYSKAAGHDINYIALSGALSTCGRKGGQPSAPVNYLGDFGGGGMVLAFGMVAALLAVKNGAGGQVIDCAMTDGSAALSAMTWGFKNAGLWRDELGVNMLDSGAHYYDTYETKDNKWISLGSIEPQFYALLRTLTGTDSDKDFDAQQNPQNWPALKEKLAAIFKTKTRDEWCATMEHTDVCFAPVLSLDEAKAHPHNIERQTFIQVGGKTQPAPVPKFSNTINNAPIPAKQAGADTDAILQSLGLSMDEISSLKSQNIIK